MEKAYIWFAIKINLLLFVITIIVAMLSGLFLWPLNLIFALTSSEFLKLIITAIWISLVAVIPNYFAFKFLYGRSTDVQNLRLIESIIYVIALKVIIDLIYLNFSEEYIEVLPTILSLLINAIMAFITFYFAGVTDQPRLAQTSGDADNHQTPSSDLNRDI